ncbi:tripartite tricarboxylate transporter substrate binding protein [Aquibacillus salsiterrae]|uniref:Tripartite tricarboxylate transporter substrate binding protein n=1 Tax=Aquibacillus salsiterrae TaxID=2950439 RepID=A0A9X3WCR1_9BACI|nr:tripartite tricarboxylate transporter substrate binding protein [Aquibacillus salsiterrae]MDC3416253.1 tripartite tricarboxylate transporter substrate binding protein [Aquibacillus salsiterrae]
MTLPKKGLLFILMIGLVFISACQSSDTSDFPNKSIQMIVAFSPGAATDTQARIIAKYADKYFGEEIAIVNKPGGGGQVGWNEFTSVKPDGYTVVAYNLPHIITQPLVNKTSFSLDTFEPIVNWGGDPTVFAVRKDSPIQSLDDLVKEAKSNPGSITVGTPGKFAGQHLATLLLEKSADIDLKDVPFKGSSDAIKSLLGGHTDVIAGNLSDIYRLGDEVTPLAIAQEERHPFDKDIPTFKELGYPEVIMSTDRGIAAREGTPDEVIETLETNFLKLLNDEDFQAEMKKAGADMLIMDREEAITDIENRQKKYKDLLQSIGVVK